MPTPSSALTAIDALARDLAARGIDTTTLREAIGEAVTGLPSAAKELDVAAAALSLAASLSAEAAECSRAGVVAGANARRDALAADVRALAMAGLRVIGA